MPLVCDVEGGPVLPAVEGGFDLVEQDSGPADGDFIAVVVAVAVCDDGDELSGSVEDPRGSLWGAKFRRNRSWRGLPSAGSMKSQVRA